MNAVLKVALAAIMGILKRFLVQEFFEWLILYAAEELVKSTKTKHDDAFLAKIKLMLGE